MSRLKDYSIRSIMTRRNKGTEHGSAFVAINFINAVDGPFSLLELNDARFEAFDGDHMLEGIEAAADLLDDFIFYENDLRISATPSPDKGDPRLIISMSGTPVRVIVY